MGPIANDSLVTFLNLAETLHFSRSARALHMSPSALTRTVQRLEEALGQPLFERSKRRVSLTRAGEILREHARLQLSAHARLLEQLSAEERTPRGELRIACTVTACHSVLPRLLSRCRARYPQIQLQLRTSDAARSLAALQADEVELAVVPEPDQPQAGLSFAPLAHTELTFIGPRADKTLLARARAGAEKWDGMPVIVPRLGLERERADAWFRARGVTPQVYAEVDGNEAILAMVSLGCGIGIVPELVRQGSPLKSAIAVIEVEAPPQGFSVSLCAKQAALGRRTMQAFWGLGLSSVEHGRC